MGNSKKASYPGKRYEATVPDSLDLADRAALAINGIGGTIDPGLDYQMFFRVYYACKTPFMQHESSDVSCDPKYAESFPMMRVMCGSDQYADIEEAQRAELVSRIKDGLYWDFFDPKRPWRTTFEGPQFDGVPREEDTSPPCGDGRMLRVLVTWRELDGDSRWDKLIHELVQGLRRIAIDHGDYSFYPKGGFGIPFSYPRSGWLKTDEPGLKDGVVIGDGILDQHAHQIQGIARWYRMSGDSKALDLAARLTRFCMLPKFWGGLPDPHRTVEGFPFIAMRLPDPACVAGSELGHWDAHFHAAATGLRGILEYAMVTGDERILEFVRRAYEYTWNFAIARIGWINCYPGALYLCEGCALGDIVALGIRLSDAGAGDYWDDVDAVVRNHLIEQQLTRADLLERISQVSPAAKPAPKPEEYTRELYRHAPYPNQEMDEDVIQRSLGNFAGNSSPTSIPKPWVMQCCTGNATQGLYYAWEGIVREEKDSAQVNLLLNRAGKSLDIDSYLPYEGKAIIHNKTARRVSVRIPCWVIRKEICSDVSGKKRPLSWVGNYLLFDGLKPGDKINIEFPIKEIKASYTANSKTKMEQTYTCTFRGSTLVDISPRDDSPTSYPLYLREHMRKDKAPMRKKTRFVSEKKILKW